MTIILCPPVFRQEDILFYSEVTHFMPNAKVLESKKATVDALAEKLSALLQEGRGRVEKLEKDGSRTPFDAEEQEED